MKLLVIEDPKTNPQENLALEEKLIDMLEEEQIILRFWVSSPSIVMGRFQREGLEVSSYAKEKNIPVYRRLSGGGTVYHDLGNLNISIVGRKDFFSNISSQGASAICTSLIASALRQIGFVIDHDTKRNALFIDGKKILGSAASIRGQSYLYHCSLLVETDLGELDRVILKNPNYSQESGSFVKSVRSVVTRLVDIKPVTIKEIKNHILLELTDKFNISDHRIIVSV